MSEHSLSFRQIQIRKNQKTHGKAHVLAVGISDYENDTHYPNLKQNDDDAIAVAKAFRGAHQLKVGCS